MGFLLELIADLRLVALLILAGQSAEGLAAVKEGLGMFDTLLSRRAHGELLRLQGELLLLRGETEAARAALEQALAEARDSGAKLRELRPAVSLARMLVRAGSAQQAQALLLETCGKFPEDSELRDFQSARALLTELSGHVPPPAGGLGASQ